MTPRFARRLLLQRRGALEDYARRQRRAVALCELSRNCIVKLSTSRPEIEVQRQRQVVEMSHSTLKGRLAGMIADGFFDSPATGSAAYSELRDRRGFSTSKPNVYRELDNFAEMGFVTKEEGGYKAVPGMKINVIEKG